MSTSWITCQPYCVCTGFWVYSPGFSAITAPENSGSMRSGVNQPRSPPLVLEESIESLLGDVFELLALVQAVDDLLRERLGGHQDVARVVFLLGHGADLRLVLGAQLLLGRLAVLQVLIRHRLLEHVEARELQQVGGVAVLVETFLDGLLAHELARG